MKVKVRADRTLIHEGKEYKGGDVVDVGDDADRVKWLQDVGTADPVTVKSTTRAGNEENSNG